MNTNPSRDTEGYLFQPEHWNEALAAEIAKEEGIELDDRYWSVVSFMRGYFQEHDIAPDVRHLIKHTATENGMTKKEAKQLVFKLFPYGYVKQACKIAGLKKPRARSTA